MEAKVGVHQPCSGPAQARAEVSSSTWRMLCLPRAPSPGNPSAAVAKTTEMFVIDVLHQGVSSAGGKGAREDDQRLTPRDLRGVKLKQSCLSHFAHMFWKVILCHNSR